MQLLQPLPALAFPQHLDTLTITNIPGQQTTIDVEIVDQTAHPYTMLSVQLAVNDQDHTATLYSLATLIRDYSETLIANPQEGLKDNFFINITVRVNNEDLAHTLVIPCRERITTSPTALLTTHFLALQQGPEPIAIPLDTTTAQPLSFIVATTNDAPEVVNVDVDAIFVSPTSPTVYQRVTAALPAHLVATDRDALYALYRADVSPQALREALTAAQLQALDGLQLTAYSARRAARLARYVCMSPALTTDPEGPHSLRYIDTFFQPQTIHFFGAADTTLKPTYSQLQTPSLQTLNYNVETTPSLCLHTGPLISSHQRAALTDLAAARHVFLLPSMQAATITEADLKFKATPGTPVQASITLRSTQNGLHFNPQRAAKTFDNTFDNSFL